MVKVFGKAPTNKISLSRQKQSAPLSLNIEKMRAARAKRGNAALDDSDNAEQTTPAVANVPTADTARAARASKSIVRKRKLEEPVVDVQPVEAVEDELESADPFADDGADDAQNRGNADSNNDRSATGDDASSSLSAGEIADEFAALKAKIELAPVRAADKRAKKADVHADDNDDDEDEEPEDMKPGVIYVGHVPNGFFEGQMRSFFGQFGEILRLRLARNKKTGMSKHYAFIEFRRLHVARLVAETMHGYIIFRRRLQCAVMSKEQQHANMWRGVPASRRRGRVERHTANARAHSAAYDTPDDAQLESVLKKQAARLQRADAKRLKALAAAGISLDAPVAHTPDAPKQKTPAKAASAASSKLAKAAPTAGAAKTTAQASRPAAATSQKKKKKARK